MESTNLFTYEIDAGMTNKIPRLVSPADFQDWKQRFQAFIEFTDAELWDSFIHGAYIPETIHRNDLELKAFYKTNPVPIRLVNDLTEKNMVKKDIKAYSILTMALPREILQVCSACQTAKSLWSALDKQFEGNDDMKESRRDHLKFQYENFLYLNGESLTSQINRFVRLVNDMRSAGITLETSDVNKRLLHSLPSSWKVNVSIIKRTEKENLRTMKMDDLIAILQSFELDSNRENYKSSQNNVGGNCAFMSKTVESGKSDFPMYTTSQSSFTPTVPSSDAQSHSSTGQPTEPSVQKSTKNTEDYVSLCTAFVSTYEAFLSGDLPKNTLSHDELEQVDPDDLEEMDLQWNMAMITVRAKRFFNRTGRNSFRFQQKGGPKIGFDKTKVRCYNCNMTGHFARECKKPKSFNQNSYQHQNSSQPQTREIAISSSMSSSSTKAKPDSTSNAALISQTQTASSATEEYNWSGYAEENDLVNHALMAIEDSLSQTTKEKVCSPQCIELILEYKEHYEEMSRDKANLKREIVALKESELKYKSKIEGLIEDKKVLCEERKSLIQENDGLKKKCDDFQGNLSETKIELEKALKKIEQLHDATAVLNKTEKAMAEKAKDPFSRPKMEYSTVPPPANYVPMPEQMLQEQFEKLQEKIHNTPEKSFSNNQPQKEKSTNNKKVVSEQDQESKQVVFENELFDSEDSDDEDADTVFSERLENETMVKDMGKNSKNAKSKVLEPNPYFNVKSQTENSTQSPNLNGQKVPKCSKCNTFGHYANKCPKLTYKIVDPNTKSSSHTKSSSQSSTSNASHSQNASQSTDTPNVTKISRKGMTCPYCHNYGHSGQLCIHNPTYIPNRTCLTRDPNAPTSQGKPMCSFCKSFGHTADECVLQRIYNENPINLNHESHSQTNSNVKVSNSKKNRKGKGKLEESSNTHPSHVNTSQGVSMNKSRDFTTAQRSSRVDHPQRHVPQSNVSQGNVRRSVNYSVHQHAPQKSVSFDDSSVHQSSHHPRQSQLLNKQKICDQFLSETYVDDTTCFTTPPRYFSPTYGTPNSNVRHFSNQPTYSSYVPPRSVSPQRLYQSGTPSSVRSQGFYQPRPSFNYGSQSHSNRFEFSPPRQHHIPTQSIMREPQLTYSSFVIIDSQTGQPKTISAWVPTNQ